MIAKIRILVLAWVLLAIALCASHAWAAKPVASAGFTPEASIAISFPKATFNAGELTTAYITISGKTNGATIIAAIAGLGVAETNVDVSNGGGSVAVTVPSIAGNYSYSASATIGGQAVMDETTITVTANHPPPLPAILLQLPRKIPRASLLSPQPIPITILLPFPRTVHIAIRHQRILMVKISSILPSATATAALPRAPSPSR